MTTWTLTAHDLPSRPARTAITSRSSREAARATLAWALLPAALLVLFGIGLATAELGAALHLDAVPVDAAPVIGPALATVQR